jgi:DNA polymerase-4
MLTRSSCVLHLDVDAFFASVEQRDDPRLRGLPVAVGTGVVASCSYEARRWGVRTGMRLSEARRLCRSLRVLPGDYRNYEQSARRILGICHEHTPRVEMSALDDLYLDLTPTPFPEAERLGWALAEQVRQEVGLSVSLGLASNKLVAAVATQQGKDAKVGAGELRSSLVAVPAGGERTYLAPWPAEILPGVGPKLHARLGRLNVNRVGEVAEMPPAVLCGLFGARGRVLRDQARGIDPRPVQPARPPQSVSRCTSFDPPACEVDFLWAMLAHLVERAASWLRLRDLAARGLTVQVRYADGQGADLRAGLPQASNDETVLKAAARERFERLYTRRLPLRLLGAELGPLQAPPAQGDLFPDPAVQKAHRLLACKDAIRARFGFMALVSGSALVVGERVEHDRENFRLRTPCLTR